MVKSDTWKKLVLGTNAFNAGRITRMMADAISSTIHSFLLKNRFISTFQAPAFGYKQAGRTPLQKENNGPQQNDFSKHRSEKRLKNLIGDTHSEGCRNGSDKVSHATDGHDHKTVHNIALAHVRTHVSKL